MINKFIIAMVQFFYVVSVGVVQEFPSTQKKGEMTRKQTLVLKEAAGKNADSFVANCWGENIISLQAGDLVAASLRFSAVERNGVYYQDINIRGIELWRKKS